MRSVSLLKRCVLVFFFFFSFSFFVLLELFELLHESSSVVDDPLLGLFLSDCRLRCFFFFFLLLLLLLPELPDWDDDDEEAVVCIESTTLTGENGLLPLRDRARLSASLIESS